MSILCLRELSLNSKRLGMVEEVSISQAKGRVEMGYFSSELHACIHPQNLG